MPTDMYSDEGPDEQPQAPADTESESTDAPTAVLPNDFFKQGDLKPGYICRVEVVRVHDDQTEIKYLGSEQDEENAEGEGQENMATSADMGGGYME